ncbi:hypothetical protein ACSHXN_45650 (plasmid) [Streptomyces sp. HUAS TT11]|uniref:hypothetical protein n=1 Tax=Streptomyces sp. HUAS TT11 TaxID=3447508 RepID=UPI003F654E23
MSQLTASRLAVLSTDVHIGTEHECKWQIPASCFADPESFAVRTFDGLIAPAGGTQDYLESVLYFDDAEGSLAAAGHTLSVVVNSGSPTSTAVLSFKQSLHQRGWRDALEMRQRVPRDEVDTRLQDTATLPVGHLHGLGLLAGPLRPSGVAVQRRFKRHGVTPGGTEIFCSMDDVHFGDPTVPKAERTRYSCLEIEVNDSGPDALADLARIAGELDDRLGVPRDLTSKSQRARTPLAEAAS